MGFTCICLALVAGSKNDNKKLGSTGEASCALLIQHNVNISLLFMFQKSNISTMPFVGLNKTIFIQVMHCTKAKTTKLFLGLGKYWQHFLWLVK